MEETYRTPLARLARFLEIFIPAYMFGKSFGIANEQTVNLFRAEFPPLLIDTAETIKRMLETQNPNLERLVATVAGAALGFALVLVLAVIMHLVLGDRRYIDSLRFTSVTLIPIAVLNGTLSHAVKTLVENLGTKSEAALTQSALHSPWGYFILNLVFYLVALWMMGQRTGVARPRRIGLLAVGLGFVGAYLAAGLMITSAEWNVLLPLLQKSLAN